MHSDLSPLFPPITVESTSDDEIVVMRVLKTLFELREEAGTGIPTLERRVTLPGRFRQAGRPITQPSVVVFGHTVLVAHIIWALHTGKLVKPPAMLQVSPFSKGDRSGIDSRDPRTWRLYDNAKLVRSAVSPNAALRLPYTDWQGRTHHASTTKVSA